MIELLITREPTLRIGDIVYFSPNWSVDDVAGKYFKIEINQSLRMTKSFIISSGSAYTFTIDDDSGLVPTRDATLYEILVGFKGGTILIYPMYPSTDYFWRLEKAEFAPDYTSSTKRYIGFLMPDDSPEYDPRLRFYTVKDIGDVKFTFYNDSSQPEKLVVTFFVNRCKMVELTEPAEKIAEIALRTPLGHVRVIPDHTDYKW